MAVAGAQLHGESGDEVHHRRVFIPWRGAGTSYATCAPPPQNQLGADRVTSASHTHA